MNLIEKTKLVSDLKEKVSDHPLCFDLIEKSSHFIVKFPYDIEGINGIRIDKNRNKSRSLTKLYEKLEEFYAKDNLAFLHDSKQGYINN